MPPAALWRASLPEAVTRQSPRPAWFPAWHGETCLIAASGPSAGDADLRIARSRCRVLVVNTSWRLAPWADALFACDYGWWRQEGGCPHFRGLKISGDHRTSSEWPNVHSVTIRRGDDRMVFDEFGVVGWGGNSGFHALNLTVQFGVSRVLLVGFDMSLSGGDHWHGRHSGGLNNPRQSGVERWRRSLDGAAPALQRAGVEVVNCSSASALQAYPKIDLEEALCAN